MNISEKHARLETLQEMIRFCDKETERLGTLVEKLSQDSLANAEFIANLDHFMVGTVIFERDYSGVFVLKKYDYLHKGTRTHSTGEKCPLKAVQIAKNVGWVRTQKEMEADDGI